MDVGDVDDVDEDKEGEEEENINAGKGEGLPIPNVAPSLLLLLLAVDVVVAVVVVVVVDVVDVIDKISDGWRTSNLSHLYQVNQFIFFPSLMMREGKNDNLHECIHYGKWAAWWDSYMNCVLLIYIADPLSNHS